MARVDQVFHLREAEKELGFAQAVRSGNTLYVSGTCAVGLDNEVVAPGDMRGQVEHIYRIITMALEAHGASFENVGAAGRDLDRSLALHAPRFRHRDRGHRRVAGRMTRLRPQTASIAGASVVLHCSLHLCWIVECALK